MWGSTNSVGEHDKTVCENPLFLYNFQYDAKWHFTPILPQRSFNTRFFSVGLRSNEGQVLPILQVFRSHKTTHRSRWDSSGRVIGPSHRHLPDNTQHSQQTHIYVPGGIRTQNLSGRAAADLHLRPRGLWDRQRTQHRMRLRRKKKRPESSWSTDNTTAYFCRRFRNPKERLVKSFCPSARQSEACNNVRIADN